MVSLTVSGDKHGITEDDGAKILRRELKSSSFKRSFQLGELLDGEGVKVKFQRWHSLNQYLLNGTCKAEKTFVKIK